MGDELQVSSTTSDAGIRNLFSLSHLLLQAVKEIYGLKLSRRLTQLIQLREAFERDRDHT